MFYTLLGHWNDNKMKDIPRNRGLTCQWITCSNIYYCKKEFINHRITHKNYNVTQMKYIELGYWDVLIRNKC